MKMFLGEYKPNFSSDSRVALPKKLREKIQDKSIVLCKGFEKCIFLYNKNDWVVEFNKHLENPITNSRSRDLKRYLYSSASENVIDSQGRFVIPKNLVQYADLDNNIIVIGAGDHIEIWNEKNWTEYINLVSNKIKVYE